MIEVGGTPNRLSILHELTSGLAGRMGRQAIARFVLSVGLDAIEARRGTLCLVTPDGLALEVVAHAGYDDAVMESWRRFPLDAPLPASDAVRSGEPIYLHSRQERADRYPMFADSGGDGASAMLPLMVRDHTLGAIVFGFDGEREFDDADRSFLAALATQCAIALDRAHLYDAALQRQADLALLVEASTVLAQADDDLDEALQRFVKLISPHLTDIASVHLLESPRESRLVASAFVENEQSEATQRASAFGPDLDAEQGLGLTLRTGQEVQWDDADEFIEQTAQNEEYRSALLAMNLGGGIIVPMLSRGRVLGACVFANHRHRTMTDDARRLARALGERAAVLLDNARLMRQRKAVSHGLQAALLPSSLPTIEGYDLGARYQSAGEGLEVGGDFYDVVHAGAGKWLLVVGDVTGHGVEAAAATGLVRHTIRSAAILGMSPSTILEHANKAMLNSAGALPTGVFCTIALASLEPSAEADDDTNGSTSSRVIVSCGGHPPPMLRRARGDVQQLEAGGRLLGFFPSVDAGEIAIDMEVGDALVAFTDGVIERHNQSGWFGERELMSLLATTDLGADALAGLVCDTVVGAFDTPPTDDLAVLVLRRTQ